MQLRPVASASPMICEKTAPITATIEQPSPPATLKNLFLYFGGRTGSREPPRKVPPRLLGLRCGRCCGSSERKVSGLDHVRAIRSLPVSPRDSTARQLDLLRDAPPRPVLRRVPDIRIEAPRAPGSTSSERAAKSIEPFRRASWKRILVCLSRLPAGAVLSREEIAARVGAKEGPLCARLSELRVHWVEKVDGACMSSSRVAVDGYRLNAAGRALFG